MHSPKPRILKPNSSGFFASAPSGVSKSKTLFEKSLTTYSGSPRSPPVTAKISASCDFFGERSLRNTNGSAPRIQELSSVRPQSVTDVRFTPFFLSAIRRSNSSL